MLKIAASPFSEGTILDCVKSATVFVADDHPLPDMVMSLASDAKGNIEVVGEADNGFDAIEKIKRVIPNVALYDIVCRSNYSGRENPVAKKGGNENYERTCGKDSDESRVS